jgi:hypothetical protein
MNGHDLAEGVVVVRAAVDTIKAIRDLVRGKRTDPAMMPVYRLVPRNGVLEPTAILPPSKPTGCQP